MRKRGTPRRRWLRRAIGGGVVVLGVSLAACVFRGGQSADAGPRPDDMPVQEGWSTPLKNPVLPAGSMRLKALWNDPSVLKDGGQYVMYMTTSVDAPFKPPIVPFRAVSSDGIAWKLDPVTPVVSPVGTAFVSVETPSVVKYHGRYHMFFTGIYPDGAPAAMAIGHAVSSDGIAWTASPDAVLSGTGRPHDWNGVLVAEPGAIVHDDTIYVYFSALAAREGAGPPQDQTIGVATTKDGEHFSDPVKVVSLSPTYAVAQGFAGYSAPSAFELGGKIHLMYDVVLSLKDANPSWQQVALQHAVSNTDGKGGFVQDAQPIFTRRSFPLTHGELIGPAALVDNGQIKLWFGGHVPVGDLAPLIRRDFSGDEFGIYYATRPTQGFP